MDNRQAYNVWANNYDAVDNKTRDLEASALTTMLSKVDFEKILEIGCGTGKNTEWLSKRAKRVVAADFSEEMLERAKEKIRAGNVEFTKTDVRKKWSFSEKQFDLVTCSLILEHIENIEFVFQQAGSVLKTGGLFYIGELHPFKQYQGSKARFDSGDGVHELECFVHHVADFFAAGKNNNFDCVELSEWFDDDDQTTIPRLLTMIFQKKS